MSRHSERIIFQCQPSIVFAACQQAVAEMGWRVFEQTGNTITFKEVVPQVTSSTHPVEITVTVIDTTQGAQVDVTGSNFGFGPVQSGHVRGQAGNFMNRLNVCLRQTQQRPAADPSGSLITELERLAALHRSGALSDAEFALAKQKLLGTRN